MVREGATAEKVAQNYKSVEYLEKTKQKNLLMLITW